MINNKMIISRNSDASPRSSAMEIPVTKCATLAPRLKIVTKCYGRV
jgi:hypothetical protein